MVIYDTFWATATDAERAAVLQHEEGHCTYDFSHDVKEALDDGCISSIMNFTLPTDECLQLHADYYQADMAAKYASKLVQDPTPLVRSDDVTVDESVASMF